MTACIADGSVSVGSFGVIPAILAAIEGSGVCGSCGVGLEAAEMGMPIPRLLTTLVWGMVEWLNCEILELTAVIGLIPSGKLPVLWGGAGDVLLLANTPKGGPDVSTPGGKGMLFAAEEDKNSGGSGIFELVANAPGNGWSPTEVGVFKTPGGRGGPEEEIDVAIDWGGLDDIGGVDREEVGVTARETIAFDDIAIGVGVLEMLADDEARIEGWGIGVELTGVTGVSLETTEDKGGELALIKDESLFVTIGDGDDLETWDGDILFASTEDGVVVGIVGEFSFGGGDGDAEWDLGGDGEGVFVWSIEVAAEGRVDAIILGMVEPVVITDVDFSWGWRTVLSDALVFLTVVGVVEGSGFLVKSVADEAIVVLVDAGEFVADKVDVPGCVKVVVVDDGSVSVEDVDRFECIGVSEEAAGMGVSEGATGMGVSDEDLDVSVSDAEADVTDGVVKDGRGSITDGAEITDGMADITDGVVDIPDGESETGGGSDTSDDVADIPDDVADISDGTADISDDVADITETADGLFSTTGSIITSSSRSVSSDYIFVLFYFLRT